MKIKLELFGAIRDFSDNDHLEIEVQDKASIDDLKSIPGIGSVKAKEIHSALNKK